jgi:hypothetical protein
LALVTDHGGSGPTEFDATLAVVAHGLLTSMSVIQGANLMLRQDWERLAPERREELLDMALMQAHHTVGVLQDLMRGVPPELTAELDRLASSGRSGIDLR